ncbi:hypothetical protein GCM10011588_65700 [Nocardia jinanensis]|uniref:Uncharacterized protein n=1 Tax=Nocardia jinanensis TaxID=382504 RepID=A0A917RX04_9NOCA|nr:hypothetical protein [Nocardia jinanensis]GGL41835.1 hypothetical protein GCM10011588_65700 [Nocardia jinanensis]
MQQWVHPIGARGRERYLGIGPHDTRDRAEIVQEFLELGVARCGDPDEQVAAELVRGYADVELRNVARYRAERERLGVPLTEDLATLLDER